MAVPASIVTGAGLRAARLYVLNSSGLPDATQVAAGTFYAGTLIQGAKVLTNNTPQVTRVSHVGEDRFLGYTVLPPKEGMTGELRTGKKNLSLNALLLGQAVVNTGESAFHGLGTENIGNEIAVALLAYQKAQDNDDSSATLGVELWSSILFPHCKLSPQRGSFDDNAYEEVYQVTPNRVSRYPWGIAFALATEKYLSAFALDGVHYGKPLQLCTIAPSSQTAYPFPTGVTAFSTSKIVVYDNNVIVSTGVTKAVDSVTFSVAPTAGHRIDVLLETL